jgi:ABC-type Fe3+-hydroxamate transport system substrate-binding protein
MSDLRHQQSLGTADVTPQSHWPSIFFDAIGQRHRPAARDARIVSLVPSLTELLCDLGLTSRVVGRTGYCVHPRMLVNAIPKIGGTKSVNLAKIERLAPTHLVCNIDENEKPTVDALARFIPHVMVTHPVEVADNRTLYRLFGGVFGRHEDAERLCAAFDAGFARVQAAPRWPRLSVVYAIWRDPWMCVSEDTYIARMLALAGIDVVPVATEDQRRYPAFDFDAIDWSRIDALLLSTEPYRFEESHAAALRAIPRFARTAVEVVDGELLSWYGSRAIPGLDYLLSLRERLLAQIDPARLDRPRRTTR